MGAATATAATMSTWDRFVFSFFNLDIAKQYLPAIAKGFVTTVYLAIAVIIAGVLLGLALALLRSFRNKAVNFFIIMFADIMRALPPLVLIILLFFALPYAGLSLEAFAATWLALSLVLAAFAEEIFWAGIVAVPRGQWEAARSTGLSKLQTLGYVVLPQAVRMTIPPLTNRVIAITKGTALGSVVALSEVLNQASSSASQAGNATPLTVGALAYLILFIPVVMFGRWVETRFAWKK
jgi:polar amino acid transport system permease protein